MQIYSYAATAIEEAPGDVVVRFRDVPEALTGGATVEAALAEAPDALLVALESYLELGREPPAPSPLEAGEHAVALSPVLAARVALVRAMGAQKLTKVALAARLGWDEKAVRLAIAGKKTSADRIFEALGAVGLRPALGVIDDGPPRFSGDPKEEARWKGGYGKVGEAIAAQQR